MAAVSSSIIGEPKPAGSSAEPLLEQGDRLSRDEFEWRYDRMPCLKRAELIEGIVYMPSPIRAGRHAEPQGRLAGWLCTYAAETPGVRFCDNVTVRLDLDNEPQPDLVLMKMPDKGGQASVSDDDYIEGAPELAVEIVGSSRAYDLHQKKGVYRRNSVFEYLAWITAEERLFWWELRHQEYVELTPDPSGLLKSGVFPGLWLDAKALLSGNMKTVLAKLRLGLDSPEHAAFVG